MKSTAGGAITESDGSVRHGKTVTSPQLSWLKGRSLVGIVFDADCHEWVIEFSAAVTLRVAAPWRIVAEGRIALGNEDEGQEFGNAGPVDVAARAAALLKGKAVERCSVAEVSGDLAIDFGLGGTLEIFNSSTGYEGWHLQCADGRLVVAQGGGPVIEFPPRG